MKQIGTVPKRTVLFQVLQQFFHPSPVTEQCIGKYNRLDVSGVEIIFLCAVILLRNLLKRLRFKEQRCGVLVGSLLLLILSLAGHHRKIRRRIPDAPFTASRLLFSAALTDRRPGFFPSFTVFRRSRLFRHIIKGNRQWIQPLFRLYCPAG